MNCKWLVFTIAFFFFRFTNAQLIYKPIELGRNLNSGTVIGTADVDGDILPDLIVIHNSAELWLGLNTGTEEFIWSQIDKKLDGNPWSVNIVDVDQNKLNDIVIAGEIFGVQLYAQLQKGIFSKTFLDTSKYYSQATCFADIDKNSFPDLFICGEFEFSKFYKNVNGQFKLDTSRIDLTINEKDSDIGNYSALWSDIDNDGDDDLYISRCRPDVANPTDRRRRNLFFHNNNGVFAEEADARNITVLDQTWVSDIGDLDNDGLQDLVVLNHYTPSIIYKQTSDHKFIDVTSQSGFNYTGNGMQLIMKDYDNDMDLDLLIVGEKNEIWLNQDNMKFVNSKSKFISSTINSCAVADFNMDGSIDILASFGDFINSPNIIRNRIFMAEKSKNNFIGFNLEGLQSNYNAIGSVVRVYSNGTIQMRELRSGESYGITNSYQIHFGLGSVSTIDSVVISWPKGTKSIFKNLIANHYYSISENGCITRTAKLSTPTKNYICSGDLLVISSDNNYSQIKWNSGSVNNSIIVSNPGIYFYEAQDSNSCKVISEPAYVIMNPSESSKLNYSDQLILCNQEEIELKAEPIQAIQWNNSINSTTLIVEESGQYFAKIKGFCSEFYSDTITIDVLDKLKVPVVRDTSISSPSTILLSTDNLNTRWYSNPNSTIPIHQGNNYQTSLISSDTEYWLERFSNTSYKSILHGYPRVNFNVLAFHNQTINGGMYFKVHEDCILDTFKVFTDRVGLRKFILQDHLNRNIDSVEVNLKRGENIILPKFKLSPTVPKYFLTTDSALNRKNFLNISPWLFRSDLGVHYPIEGNLLTFLHSESGEAEYHYFYYCQLRKPDKECTSERVPLRVKLINAVDDKGAQSPRIEFVNNDLFIYNDNQEYNLTVLNSSGGQILNLQKTYQSKISLQNIPSGIYFVNYSSLSGQKSSLKIIKTK